MPSEGSGGGAIQTRETKEGVGEGADAEQVEDDLRDGDGRWDSHGRMIG